MANTRMAVIVRRDLQMPAGLLAAQVSHISMEFIRLKIDAKNRMSELSKEELAWVKEPYLSVLAVECFDDLESIIEHADREKLPYSIWSDTVPSPTFPDRCIKTMVGCAIGPEDFDKIKVVTGGLEIY